MDKTFQPGGWVACVGMAIINFIVVCFVLLVDQRAFGGSLTPITLVVGLVIATVLYNYFRSPVRYVGKVFAASGALGYALAIVMMLPLSVLVFVASWAILSAAEYFSQPMRIRRLKKVGFVELDSVSRE